VHAGAVAGGGHEVQGDGQLALAAEVGQEDAGTAQQRNHHDFVRTLIAGGDLFTQFGDPGGYFSLGDHHLDGVFHHLLP